jgi:uncharacterized protein
MTLLEKIRKDVLEAVKEGEDDRVDILKIAIASLKNAEIEKGEELDDNEQEQILRKEVKKLKDAYEQYVDCDRQDLAEREKRQMNILESYLPKFMEEEEVREIVQKKIEELGADSSKDMGRVMGAVMKELSGKADGGTVNKIVKEVLNED